MTAEQNILDRQPRDLTVDYSDRLNKASQNIWDEIGNDIKHLGLSIAKLDRQGGRQTDSQSQPNSLDFGSSSDLYGTDTFHPQAAPATSDSLVADNAAANNESVSTNDSAAADTQHSADSQSQVDLTAALNDIKALIDDLARGDTAALKQDLANLVRDLSSQLGLGDNSHCQEGGSNECSPAGDCNQPSDSSYAGNDSPQPSDSSYAGNDSAAGDTTTNEGADAPISLSDVLKMQDSSQNQVVPGLGAVERGFGWAKGATGGWPNANIPDNGDSATPWMTAFPIDGQTVNPNATIDVNNLNTYALLKDGSWQKLPSAENGNTWGEINPPDFTSAANLPTKNNADGSFTVAAPPDGSVDQFGGGGGSFDRSQIVGIYESAQVRSNMENSGLAVQLGGDIYSSDPNSGGQLIGGRYYLQQFGTSNWMKLTNQYQTIAMTNIDAATLASNPPPGVGA